MLHSGEEVGNMLVYLIQRIALAIICNYATGISYIGYELVKGCIYTDRVNLLSYWVFDFLEVKESFTEGCSFVSVYLDS